MITTNDTILAERCRLLMNHAEAVINDRVDQKNGISFPEMWGFNMRMTEIQAAVLQEQLKKLDFFIGKRQENAEYLAYGLNSTMPCLRSPMIRPNCTHTFYLPAVSIRSRSGRRNP